MEIISWIILISYAIACGALVILWFRMPVFRPSSSYKIKIKVSVIVPVRNEAKNIVSLLQSLDNQHLNKESYEVIVVNDVSTDETKAIIESYAGRSDLSIKLINLGEMEGNSSPKKRAITEAMKIATGDLIITTDGDCTMEPYWIATIAEFHEQTNSFFISAPVTFYEEKTNSIFNKIWQKFQLIEFGSLIGAGACAIKLGSPNMCSGANIAFKKEAFIKVGGYEGNEHIASGDDEFLMQKIATAYPDKVQYLKSKEAIVQTQSQANILSFYQQRIRWASKWRYYKNWQPTALAVYIAIVNAAVIWAVLFGHIDLILVKFSFEFVFLSAIVLFLEKDKSIAFIPLTQLIYPFYVIIIALTVQWKSTYNWKGRKLH